jgi:aminoglycoside 3-N-acetyltransferase
LLKKKFNQKKNLKLLFDRLKIKKNDCILFHSNIAGIYQFKKKVEKKILKTFLQFILNRIGSNGTVLFPTYNYDFTKGKVFNSKNSNSQVGEFSNYLLKTYQINRTTEPIFNHLVFGKLKSNIFNSKIYDAFGNQSVFSIVEKKNFKIVCFCCSPDNMTFLHYIEQKLNVKYRYNKYFSGYAINKKKKKQLLLKYFVGKKNMDYKIKEEKLLNLTDKKNFIATPYGRFNCYSVKAQYLLKILKPKIKKNNNYLITKN